MSQNRTGSIAEALLNSAIGWSVNFCANLVLLPLLYDSGHVVRSAFWIGVAFTGISVVRSYMLRRWFNAMSRFRERHSEA